MARKLILLQDNREKIPLLFPENIKLRGRIWEVEVKKAKLSEGDYQLEGSSGVIVERKRNIRELHQNLVTHDKRRMKKALDRLTKVATHPVIVVEGTVSQLFQKSKYCPNPSTIVQKLLDECVTRGISLWPVGRCSYPAKRRRVGELVLRMLIAGADV